MHPPTHVKDRLIVALDVETLADAERMVDRLEGLATRFKIGSPLFTAAGPGAVEAIQKRGAEVFLDLKFHDIPNTVAGAAREATRMGVLMFNVHDCGGRAVWAGAADGAPGEVAQEPGPGLAQPRAGSGALGGGPRASPGRARRRGRARRL